MAADNDPRVSAATSSGNLGSPIFHRVQTPTHQTALHADEQVRSREIWGRPHRIGGAIPCVKAYAGPLPTGTNGVEFTTNVPPTHSHPGMVLWVHGYHPAIDLRQKGADDYAVITVDTITKVP
jgi:hypothetical protein